jgi:hypothetical protein
MNVLSTECPTQRRVRSVSLLHSHGFIVDLPENGKPNIWHPIAHMTEKHSELIDIALAVCTGTVRNCPSFHCQALFYWDHIDGMWHCTNTQCQYYRWPVSHGRMVTFDQWHRQGEAAILQGRARVA